MKYIKSRSNFLNEKKHNLILEGGLQNDINWGDSLVGRLFSSAFRLGSKAINNKRLDGLGNTLRDRLLKDTFQSVTDENPEIKEQVKEFERRLYLLSKEEGLLDVLKTGKINDIKLYMESMSDDDIEEIINNLTNKNEDSIEALIAIQNWVKNSEPKPKPEPEDEEPEDEEPEVPEVKVTDGDKDQEKAAQIINNYTNTVIHIVSDNSTNNISNDYSDNRVDNSYKQALSNIQNNLDIDQNTLNDIKIKLKEIHQKMEDSEGKTNINIKKEITNNIDVLVNIINNEINEDPEPKKKGEKEPEGKKPKKKGKKPKKKGVKPTPKEPPYEKLKTPSRLLQFQIFLRFGGVDIPDISEVDGQWTSALKGDNYDAGPNAKWIHFTKKVPTEILNRLIMAFPEENISFDKSVRIKSTQPGKKFNSNNPDNLIVYKVVDGKEKPIKKVDLKSDSEKWNFVLNGTKNSDYKINLTPEQVKNFTKNKKNILKWLKYCFKDNYDFNYGKNNKPKEKQVTKKPETIKKDSKGKELKVGDEVKLKDNSIVKIKSTEKDGNGKKLKHDGLFVKGHNDNDGEIIKTTDVKNIESSSNESVYFIRESSYFVNEAVLSDYFQEDLKTQIIVKDDKIETVTFDETKEPLKYNFWVNNYLKPVEIEKNRIEIEKAKTELEKVMKEPKWVINVFDIIKIFKKASRIYIKTNIPSQRTNGQVTRAIANSWETLSGGGVSPESPGNGPFRNIKLYDKWNKIVIDIINEFDYALKKDDSRVVLSDGSEPIKPKNSIYKFIIDALEGDKISGKNKSDQLTFLQGYFGEENTEDIVDAFAGKLDEPKTDKPKEQDPKVDGDKPEKKKSKFTEVNEINTKKSGLYKLKLTERYKSDGGYLPNGSKKEVYVYIRNKEERKALYLFEDYNIIKDKMSSKSEFNESGDVSGVNKDIYITKLPGTISKKGLVDNIKAIKFEDKNPVEFKGSGITIDKIEKINSVYLAKLGTLDGYNIGDTIPFENS